MKRRYLILAGAMLFVLAVLVSLWMDSCREKYYLNNLPQKLAVTRSDVLSVQSRSWGFGPGGNEVGVAVFLLPPRTLEQINDQGFAFFSQGFSSDSEQGGKFQTWQETPITDQEWAGEGAETLSPALVSNFLYQNGFGMELESYFENEINSAVNSKGSFYSKSGLSVLLVLPANRKIVYLLRG